MQVHEPSALRRNALEKRSIPSPRRVRVTSGLFPDLPADGVLLLVERALLLLRDVAAVLRCHCALFLADLAVFLVQLGGLALRHLARLHFVLDALVLVIKTAINLRAARMILLPVGPCCKSAPGDGGDKSGGHCNNVSLDHVDVSLSGYWSTTSPITQIMRPGIR